MNREADSPGANGNGILTFVPEREDEAPEPAPKAKAQAKPKVKGAASLTADVVARGRQRTQVYGEAGLWRGAAVPPASEAPVRVVFPPVREPAAKRDVERDAEHEAKRNAEREQLAREVLSAGESPSLVSPTGSPERETDLSTQVIGALLVFAAVFVLGILLF